MSGKPWSAAELKTLRMEYPNKPTSEIAKDMGRTILSIYMAAATHGLKKSAAYLASPASGRTNGRQGIGSRFPKGNVPWNAGLKGWSAPGTEKTRFHKGNKPQTWVPVGTEVIDPDGYKWRKVSESPIRLKRWRPVHVLLWEKKRGKIPKGKIVIFKNRDKADIRIGNLMLMDREGLMKWNTLHRYPKEIVRASLQMGWINRVIRERMKDGNG